MAKVFDVYRDWLGIQDKARPLNHYQLLRLDKFEDNPSKIRSNYRQLVSHVNKNLTGQQGDRVAGVVKELTTAMLCLTDAVRKEEYDAALGRSDGGKLRQRSFEEGLIASKVVDKGKLAEARDYADAIGLELRDAVLQKKMAAPDIVMRAFAESVGLPYFELDDTVVAKDLVTKVPAAIGRQHSCVPIMGDEKIMLLASPNPLAPEVEKELESKLKKKVRTVLCTSSSINDMVARYYPREAVAAEAAGKKRQPPPDPATPPPAPPKTPEQEFKWHSMLAGILGFNITVIVTMIALGFYRGALYRMGWWDIVYAAILGIFGAAIGRALGPSRPKRR